MVEVESAAATPVLGQQDVLPSKKKKKRFSENRGLTMEPLPPPPPPPPQDTPEYPAFAFFRMSSSQPNLSTIGYCGSSLNSGADDSKPSTQASNTYGVGESKSGAVGNQSHAPNLDDPSCAREAGQEKGKSSPDAREANRKQPSMLSSEFVTTQSSSGADEIWLKRHRRESAALYYRQQVQSSFRTPPARSNNKSEDSFEFTLAPVQKRPTSLFRPGQAATFYEDHRLSVPHLKNPSFQAASKVRFSLV